MSAETGAEVADTTDEANAEPTPPGKPRTLSIRLDVHVFRDEATVDIPELLQDRLKIGGWIGVPQRDPQAPVATHSLRGNWIRPTRILDTRFADTGA